MILCSVCLNPTKVELFDHVLFLIEIMVSVLEVCFGFFTELDEDVNWK